MKQLLTHFYSILNNNDNIKSTFIRKKKKFNSYAIYWPELNLLIAWYPICFRFSCKPASFGFLAALLARCSNYNQKMAVVLFYFKTFDSYLFLQKFRRQRDLFLEIFQNLLIKTNLTARICQIRTVKNIVCCQSNTFIQKVF